MRALERVRAGALTAALAGGAAWSTATAVSCLHGPAFVASGVVRTPVLDGVPLVDVERVEAELRAAGAPPADALEIRRGARWHEVVVVARRDSAAAALATVDAVLAPVAARHQALLEQARRVADELETPLVVALAEARRSGSSEGIARAQVGLESFRLKRRALTEWSGRLVDGARLEAAPGAGPLVAALVSAGCTCVLFATRQARACAGVPGAT